MKVDVRQDIRLDVVDVFSSKFVPKLLHELIAVHIFSAEFFDSCLKILEVKRLSSNSYNSHQDIRYCLQAEGEGEPENIVYLRRIITAMDSYPKHNVNRNEHEIFRT